MLQDWCKFHFINTTGPTVWCQAVSSIPPAIHWWRSIAVRWPPYVSNITHKIWVDCNFFRCSWLHFFGQPQLLRLLHPKWTVLIEMNEKIWVFSQITWFGLNTASRLPTFQKTLEWERGDTYFGRTKIQSDRMCVTEWMRAPALSQPGTNFRGKLPRCDCMTPASRLKRWPYDCLTVNVYK